MVAPSAEAMRIWMDVIVTGAEGYTQFMNWELKPTAARWPTRQNRNRSAGRLQMTQTCYSQWEEKLYFVTSFFSSSSRVSWRCYIFTQMHRQISTRGFPCLPGLKKGEDEKTRWTKPAGGGSLTIDENAFLPLEIFFHLQFILSGCAETWLSFQFVPRFVFSNIMGKMPNAIKPFWNSVALNIWWDRPARNDERI